jgi:hypothetical protein
MRKNKMNTKLLIIVGIAVLSAFCSGGGNRVEVRIEVPDPQVISLDKYDTIVYKDLALESMPKDFNPEPIIREFFLGDFTKAVEKKVEIWDSEKHGDGKMSPTTLLVTGTLKADIKERSKIGDKKDETGKKIKTFISIQHWSLRLSISMKNAADGSEFFKETFEEKLADANPSMVKFNFENLFFKLSSQLVSRLIKTKKIERRYLLL